MKGFLKFGAVIIVLYIFFSSSSSFMEGFNGAMHQKSAPTINDRIKKADFFDINDLNAAYKKNEVATNNSIHGKDVLIGGIVHAISEDFSNTPVIEMNTKDSFIPSRLHLTDEQRDKAAQVEKGMKLMVLCPRVSFVVGTVNAQDCTIVSQE